MSGPAPDAGPLVLVIMGVSGSGKTTIGQSVALRLQWPFKEGDDLHSRANIEKMRSGRPLTDGDRGPWLSAIADWIDARLDAGHNGVITSSALKRSYRDVINRRGRGVLFVFLRGSQAEIAERLATRREHFMPPSLLQSQFDDLEPPGPDEPSLTFDVGTAPEAILDGISLRFGGKVPRV